MRGGGTIESQTVSEGKKAVKPKNDPEKVGYTFDGWQLNGVPYSFDTPVTQDITLVAAWKVEELSVTFKSEGLPDDVKKVIYGNAAVQPKDPERSGYIFDGWYNGSAKYDFSAPVTADLVLTAKWLSQSDLNLALTQALNADYTNYTSVRRVVEVEDKTETAYTITYKRTKTAAHNVTEPKSVIDPERYIVYDDSGALLAGYYRDNDGNWAKSSLGSFEGIVLSMNTNQLSAEDFAYKNGRYVAYDESLVAIEYCIFGTMQNLYRSFYMEVKDGKIAAIGGELANSTVESVITFTQTFTAIGTTQIEKPSALPAAEVVITKKDKTYTEGDAMEKADLLALFTIKADGRTIAVSEDMIDFSTLDVSTPAAVGTYTLTLTYTDWNGASHSETATVTVNPKQSATLTFAEIFEKDYTNVTIDDSSTTPVTFTRNGNLYYFANAAGDNYVYVNPNTKQSSFVQYKTASSSITTPKWIRSPRLDLIFELDVALFKSTSESVYTVSSDDALDSNTVSELTAIFKANELGANYIIVDNDTANCPFSISIKVSNNSVAEIVLSYYSKMTASAKPSKKEMKFTLRDIGSTQPIAVSNEIKTALGMTE